MTVLEQVFPNGFLDQKSYSNDNSLIQNKVDVVIKGEIAISKKILQAGLGLRCSLYPDFFYKNGDKWILPTGDMRFLEEFRGKVNQFYTL